MSIFKKDRKSNLDKITVVSPAVYNGKLATFSNFLILQIDARYIISANGDVRSLCTLAKIDYEIWGKNDLMRKWASSQGYDLNSPEIKNIRLSAIIIPAWTLKKIKIFKPTSAKNIRRAIAYLIARQTFPTEYITPDGAVTRLTELGKQIADSDENMNQKNFKRLEYLIDMLTQKKDDHVLTDAEMDMVAMFIAAITEGTKPREINHAVRACLYKQNHDIHKTFKKNKVHRKDGEAPKDYSDFAAPSNDDLKVDDEPFDDEDDSPEDTETEMTMEDAMANLKKAAAEAESEDAEDEEQEVPEKKPLKHTATEAPVPPRNREERRKAKKEAKFRNEVNQTNKGKPTQVKLQG